MVLWSPMIPSHSRRLLVDLVAGDLMLCSQDSGHQCHKLDQCGSIHLLGFQGMFCNFLDNLLS